MITLLEQTENKILTVSVFNTVEEKLLLSLQAEEKDLGCGDLPHHSSNKLEKYIK